MDCRAWKLVAVVLCLIGLCDGRVSSFAQDSDKIEVAEIARRLSQWRSSFVNLRGVWEIRSLTTTTEEPLINWGPPDDPESGVLFLRKEWVWADHGLDYFASTGTHGTKEPWSVEVFNGPKGFVFRANYKQMPDGARALGQLVIRDVVTGKPTSSLERVPLGGLYWSGSAAWLPDLLSEWKWTVEAIEDVNGASCVKIVAKEPWYADIDWLHILWIDLNHDCLVRRHLRPRIPERRTGRDFIVDEFQRLENGVWFPKRGRFQMEDSPYQNQSWTITEVALNETLDITRFEPPVPVVGTLVDDGKRSVYSHGTVAKQPTSITNTDSESISHQSSGSPSAALPVSGWLWWSGGFVTLSFVLLVVGFFFWRKS